MIISPTQRRTRLTMGLSLFTLLTLFVLLFTRFGVFLVFDVLADIGGTDTSGAAYQDAPVRITSVLSDPTEIDLPNQIEQVSGILKTGETLIVSTDQSEVFSIDPNDPSRAQGGNLFPSTPLLMRQGRLEAIAWAGEAFHLVGEHGAFVRIDAEFARLADQPLPPEIAGHEFSGLAAGPERFFLTSDGVSDVLTMSRSTGEVEALVLDFGALSDPRDTASPLFWSGIAHDTGLLYLAADAYPIIAVASAETGEVIDVFGIDGALQFSDIAVSDGRVFLPRDHNYFDARPPVLVFDLPRTDGHDDAEGSAQGAWYHPMEVDEWIASGADPEVVAQTIERIATADGPRRVPHQPDTLLEYGPGHWTYEWSQAGDEALSDAMRAAGVEAQSAMARQAVLYYSLASSPHLNTAEGQVAMEKAREAYLLAARAFEARVDRVSLPHEGKTFDVFVHVPEGHGPFPVVVISNGSDQSKEGLFGYFADHLLPRGIAMISLDLPGMGDSAAFDLLNGQSDKLHLAAVHWALAQDMFIAAQVFLQGSSFGGNAAARAFLRLDRPALAGVILNCAPLDQPFLAPPEAYDHMEAFTIDGVKARFDLPPEASGAELAPRLRAVALSSSGAFDGPMIDTPLLAFTTTADPVAPMEDFEALLARAEDATPVVVQGAGHCVEDDIEAPRTAEWIASQVSGG